MADYKQMDYRPLGEFGSSGANDGHISNARTVVRAMHRLGLETKALESITEMAAALNRYVFNADRRDERAAR